MSQTLRSAVEGATQHTPGDSWTPVGRQVYGRESTRANAIESMRRTKSSGRGTHPTTSDRQYSDEEVNFLREIAEFQTGTGTKFPTWSQVLGVVKGMGYQVVPHGYQIVAVPQEALELAAAMGDLKRDAREARDQADKAAKKAPPHLRVHNPGK